MLKEISAIFIFSRISINFWNLKIFQLCLTVHQVLIKDDPKFIKNSVLLFNDGVHDTLVSRVSDLKVDLEKLTVRYVIKLPETEDDHNYMRIIFRNSLDVTKFVNEVQKLSSIAKFILDAYASSLSTELKFPIKKVRCQQCSSLILTISQGLIVSKNISITDNLIPLVKTTKFCAEVKFIGKFSGIRKSLIYSTWTFYGEIKRL